MATKIIETTHFMRLGYHGTPKGETREASQGFRNFVISGTRIGSLGVRPTRFARPDPRASRVCASGVSPVVIRSIPRGAAWLRGGLKYPRPVEPDPVKTGGGRDAAFLAPTRSLRYT
jgi:hypothetical protein